MQPWERGVHTYLQQRNTRCICAGEEATKEKVLSERNALSDSLCLRRRVAFLCSVRITSFCHGFSCSRENDVQFRDVLGHCSTAEPGSPYAATDISICHPRRPKSACPTRSCIHSLNCSRYRLRGLSTKTRILSEISPSSAKSESFAAQQQAFWFPLCARVAPNYPSLTLKLI